MSQADRLLIAGGQVFDGERFQARDIVVEGDTISAVDADLSADAAVLDAAGTWIIPGLIDMHVHISGFGMEAMPVLVGNGVTTVRDLGGPVSRLRQMQLDVDSGKVVGPNVIYSGPSLDEKPHGSLEDPVQAKDEVRRMIAEDGVGSIKIYASVGEPIAAAILDAADGRVPVTCHLGRTSSKFVLEHGIGGVEHVSQSLIRDLAPKHAQLHPDDWTWVPGFNAVTLLRTWAEVDPDGPELESWLNVFLRSNAFLDPTITIFSAQPMPGDPRLNLVPLAQAAAERRGEAQEASNPRSWVDADTLNGARTNQRLVMQRIYQAGAELVLGTDLHGASLPGFHLHSEMLAFKQRGVKALDILRSATSIAAKHLWRDDLGTIAPGKRADIVILEADPLEDITNAQHIRQVVKDGTVHDTAKLLALA